MCVELKACDGGRDGEAQTDPQQEKWGITRGPHIVVREILERTDRIGKTLLANEALYLEKGKSSKYQPRLQEPAISLATKYPRPLQSAQSMCTFNNIPSKREK